MTTADRVTVTVDEVAMLLEGLPTNIAIFLWGPPGIGKSAVVKQYTDANKQGFYDIRLATVDPLDLRGLPYHDKDTNFSMYAEPGRLLPHLSIKGTPKKGIIFLDELPAAHPTVQNAAYQLVFDKKVGDYEVPEGYRVMAAGNRMQDGIGTFDMPPALKNRFVHFEVVADKHVWLNWAITNDVDHDVVAFISQNPDRLAPQPQSTQDKQRREFPTPRTWVYLSDVKKSELSKTAPKLAFKSYCGAVGSGDARQFLTFVELKDKLPSLKSILLDGEKLNLPTEVHFQFAFYSALCSFIDDYAVKIGNSRKAASNKKFIEGLSYIVLTLENPEFKQLVLRYINTKHQPIVAALMMNPTTAAFVAKMFAEMGLISAMTGKKVA